MTQSFEQAQWYVHALTGHPETVIDWRAIHDTNKGVPAHNMRGTIRDMFPKLVEYNQAGWGIFACINQMDGHGHHMANVQCLRAHVVDLDNTLTSAANYEKAINTYPQPHIAVQSSPGKYHLYWLTEPYVGNEFYTHQQRKLAQLYDGDKSIIDAPRVLRVPGFYHLKAQPYLANVWGIHAGPRINFQTLADSLAHITAIQHISSRAALGAPELAAPSLEWLNFALHCVDPNQQDRQEWMSISAAFKQAGWTLATEPQLLDLWQKWCARYEKNDPAENLKMWNSFRETEVGWGAFERRTMVRAYMMQSKIAPQPELAPKPAPPITERNHVSAKEYGDILSPVECSEWFHNCFFVSSVGEIFTSEGRFMNSSQFNGKYGGKHFVITSTGKTTDEPWKAALRSTQWTVPKIDHTRFLPQEKPFAVVKDRMGRTGLNTFIPVVYDAIPGDVSPWLELLKYILPDERDREIIHRYMAHCIKFPGFKIPWAPVIQSVQGVGKSAFFEIMEHALGEMYIYKPKAKDLVDSGSKFNAWMRHKLCILVDEIWIAERRDLVEALKPMISDAKLEVQAKGQDQVMEDIVANWIMFSNHKDCVPIGVNDRRYAVFFSALQSKKDLKKLGLSDDYYDKFFNWLKDQDGKRFVTHWLLNYNIEKGQIPRVAPDTSTYEQVLHVSRSPMEIVVEDAIADNTPGFRGGYVSTIAVTRRVTAQGMKSPSPNSIRSVLETMGYKELGRAVRVYAMEHLTERATIYATDPDMPIEGYGAAQGY